MTEAHDTRDLHESVHDEPNGAPVEPQPGAGENGAPEGEGGSPFKIEDFVGGGPAGEDPRADEAPAEPKIEPYTDDEIAQGAAVMSFFGLPMESFDAYTQAFVQRATPILRTLAAGDALAELGIHKGNGPTQAPAWARAAAAGLGLGWAALTVRAQFQPAEGGGDASMDDHDGDGGGPFAAGPDVGADGGDVGAS